MGKRPLSMWARRWFPSIGERESFTRCFKIMERKLVLQSMVSTYSNISVKNIDTAYPQVLELLHSLQFKEVTRQFEMSKKLS